MTVYAATRKGKNKSHSEDRIVIDEVILNDECRLFENIIPKIIGISDGVGGNDGGDIAAQFLCERINLLSDGEMMKNFSELKNELLRYAGAVSGKEKMAATLSAVIFGKETKIFHIGNTRIFAVQGSYLKQITNDHTTYNLLRFRGLYEEADHCNKSEIVSCFGGGNDKLFSPDIVENFIPKRFIISSDGIHDYVDIDSMEEIICSEKSCQEICDKLMQTALNNGSCDDMSIVLGWL